MISQVLQNFDLIEGDSKKRIAECKLCGVEYTAPCKNGTGNMRKHLDKCPMRVYWDIRQLVFSQGTLSNHNFNFENFRELLCICVIMHDFPFSFVEWDEIRSLLQYLRSNISPVSRNTCKYDCLKPDKREKKQNQIHVRDNIRED